MVSLGGAQRSVVARLFPIANNAHPAAIVRAGLAERRQNRSIEDNGNSALHAGPPKLPLGPSRTPELDWPHSEHLDGRSSALGALGTVGGASNRFRRRQDRPGEGASSWRVPVCWGRRAGDQSTGAASLCVGARLWGLDTN